MRRWHLGWVWAAPGTVGAGAGEVKLAVGAQRKVQKCDTCVCVYARSRVYVMYMCMCIYVCVRVYMCVQV